MSKIRKMALTNKNTQCYNENPPLKQEFRVVKKVKKKFKKKFKKVVDRVNGL